MTRTRFYIAAATMLAAGSVAGMTFLPRPPSADAQAQCLVGKLNMVNAKWDVSETSGETLSIKVSTKVRGKEIGRKVVVLPYHTLSDEPPVPDAKYIYLILTERRDRELVYSVDIITDGNGRPNVRRGWQTNSRIVNPQAGIATLMDAAAACGMLGKLDTSAAKAQLARLSPR